MESVIVKCPSCGQRNRVVPQSESVAFRCGNKACRADLSLELPPPFNRGVVHPYITRMERIAASHFGEAVPPFAVLIRRGMRDNASFVFWSFDEEYDCASSLYNFFFARRSLATNWDFGPQLLAILYCGRLITKARFTDLAYIGAELKPTRASGDKNSECSDTVNQQIHQLLSTWSDESRTLTQNICDAFANEKPYMRREDGVVVPC